MDLVLLKKIVLDTDTIADRSWQLYVNGDRLLQIHPGTNKLLGNPKITQLKTVEATQLSELTDKLWFYEVRIIKHDDLADKIGKRNEYSLSFNQGVSQQTYQLIEIKESKVQNLAWHLILAR